MKEINNNNDGFNIVKLDEFSFNIDVDFIKIDTEGSEFSIKMSIDIIKKNRPMIQIETNECSNKDFMIKKKYMIE